MNFNPLADEAATPRDGACFRRALRRHEHQMEF